VARGKLTDDGPAADSPGPLAPRADSEGWETLEQALGSLEAGQALSVTRTAPAYARGWCEDLPVPADADSLNDVRQQIRLQYGGGTYVLQWKHRRGKTLFGRGSAVITIAGDPMYRGRRYRHGVLEEMPDERMVPQSSSAAQAPTPVIVQAPAPAGGDALQTALLGIVQTALGGKEQSPLDVVQLVTALQTSLKGGASSEDTFGTIERVMSLMAKAKKAFRRDDDDDDEPRQRNPQSATNGGGLLDGLLGGDGGGLSLEKILMIKLLGDGGGLGGLGGLLGQAQPPRPAAPAMQPGPPGHVWHPQAGWIPYAAPTPQPTPQVQTQTQTLDPRPAAPATAPAEGPLEGDDVDEDPPYSADEIAADILSRPPEEQEAFLGELISKLAGSPVIEKAAAAVEEQAQQQQGFTLNLPSKGRVG